MLSITDNFNELLRVFSIHHSAFEVPNFFNNRISIKSRFVSKPTTQFRPKLIRPAASPLSAITDGIKDRLKAIYPGTLWCGDGTHAKNQNEIGLFRNTDICCKQHDECPAFIKAGSEFKGLRNTGLFTRSHCDCDLKFYNCLKRTGTLISGKIGYTYFNILRPQCFRKEYPIVGCKKWYELWNSNLLIIVGFFFILQLCQFLRNCEKLSFFLSIKFAISKTLIFFLQISDTWIRC